MLFYINTIKTSNIDYYDNPRLDLIPHIPKNIKNILNVGCGTGSLGFAIKEKISDNIKVSGIEMNVEAGNIAKSNIDNVMIGNVENLDIDTQLNSFDCIIYADVLEHLIDPWDSERCILPPL